MSSLALCVLILQGATFRPGILSEYRIPDTRASALYVTVSPRASWHTDSADRYTAGLRVAPASFYGVTSEKLYLDCHLSAASEATPLMHDLYDTAGARYYSYRSEPKLDLLADWYPSPLPIGLDVETDFSSTLSSMKQSHFGERLVLLQGSGLAGPVLGRVRDATPVITALRVARILAAENQLAEELDETEIQSLANLIACHWAYMAEHDAGRGEKYFCRSLERFLGPRSRDGEGLPAYTWFHVRDEINRASSSGDLGYPTRPVGIRLTLAGGAGASQVWRTTMREMDTTSQNVGQHYPVLKAELDGGWPLSLRLHFSGSAIWQSTFYSHGIQHYFRSNISLSHLFGELLKLDASLVPVYQADEDTLSDSWSGTCGASAWLSGTWYVEDRFIITTSAGLGSQLRTRRGSASRNLSTAADLGFSYRIR
jgi:hypothetical protein